MFSSSPHSAAISLTWARLPLASLTPFMLGSLHSSASVAGRMLQPVRLGTLYRMQGSETAFAIAEKCAISPAWLALL